MQERYRQLITDYFKRNWRWLLLGMILGVVVFITALLNGYVMRISNMSQIAPVSGLTVVAVPTETEPIPTTQVVEVATPTESPTLPPSTDASIKIGELVTVSNTDGDRLRLRTQPGLSSEVGFLAYENDVFQVENGPVEQDGYVWWFLVNPYDSSKSGWAVENYLSRMENP
jgi:hypothetical protein